jgi:hypothetical protein
MSDSKPPPRAVSLETLLLLLQEGRLEIQGLLPNGSNYTFLAVLTRAKMRALAVYKPTRGEQPLWDFPEETLAYREVAAYLTSDVLGWDFVPPTVYRTEGPHGPGSLQYFIQAQPDCHYFTFSNEEKAELPRVALFDLLINNADRKGGHIIPMRDGHVHGVDHGVCFSVDPKLRTLLWRWAGTPLPVAVVEVLERLADDLRGDLGDQLHEHLTRSEVQCTQRRVAELLRTGLHPEPTGEWPALPWPPF